MNKPINRKTDKIENHRITPPHELEPLYDKLQALEDTILTTRKYRDALLQLDPHTQGRVLARPEGHHPPPRYVNSTSRIRHGTPITL